MKETILGEIKTLPPLPASVIRIQELCLRDDTDVDELARVIEGDPMLSANILKSANSPLYGMSREITLIPRAIMLFGISMIRGFAAANAIKKAMPVDLSPYGISLERLTEVSALQSTLVRQWYRKVDKGMIPMLQTGAFLMELGKLPAANHLIRSGRSGAFEIETARGMAIMDTERLVMGMSSYEIAAMMFEHWNFEPALVEMLRGIGDPQSLNPYSRALRVIALALDIQDPLGEGPMARALEAIDAFALDREAFGDAVNALRTGFDEFQAQNKDER